MIHYGAHGENLDLLLSEEYIEMKDLHLMVHRGE